MFEKMSLESIPFDCLDVILKQVNLPTLKSLRLVSHKLKDACTEPYFASFVRHPCIDVTESSLQSLLSLVFHPDLGRAVNELTLRAPSFNHDGLYLPVDANTQDRWTADDNWLEMYDDDELFNLLSDEERSAAQLEIDRMKALEEEQERLSSSFISRSLVSAFQRLPHLRGIDVDVVVFYGPNLSHQSTFSKYHSVGNFNIRVSRLYCITMSAIVESGIALESLSFYAKAEQYAVPLNDLATHLSTLDDDALRSMGASIKHFGIKICSYLETGVTDPTRKNLRYMPETLSDGDVEGFTKLLRYMPNLQALELRFSNSLSDKCTGENRELFETMATTVPLQSLRELTLFGVYTSRACLIRFLQNRAHIQDVTLKRVAGVLEHYPSCFEYINMRVSQVIDSCSHTDSYPLCAGCQLLKVS